jgi:hypothetical protein
VQKVLIAACFLLALATPAAAFTAPFTVSIAWTSGTAVPIPGTNPVQTINGTLAAVTVTDSLGATVLTQAYSFPPTAVKADILRQLRHMVQQDVALVAKPAQTITGTDTFVIQALP